MSDPCWFVQALALGIEGAWRRRPAELRAADLDELNGALTAPGEVVTYVYSCVGMRPGADLLLWRLAPSWEALESSAAQLLQRGLGAWCTPSHTLVGVVQGSPYGRRQDPGAVPALFRGARQPYLIVYPFTKTTDWWQLDEGERHRVMGGHIAVGRAHPGIPQLLANSFGLDDQDFLVAYETERPEAFAALVRDLRSTEARRWTARDTPILVGRLRTAGELRTLLASVGRGSAIRP